MSRILSSSSSCCRLCLSSISSSLSSLSFPSLFSFRLNSTTTTTRKEENNNNNNNKNNNPKKNVIAVAPSSLPNHNILSFSLSNILSKELYKPNRKSFIRMRRQIKETRRVEIGPHSAITFQNYDILWVQIQEMLYIEKGDLNQQKEEVEAYSPLLPQRNYLTFTFMVELDNKPKRDALLRKIVGVENHMHLLFSSPSLLSTNSNAPVSLKCQAIEEEGVERQTQDKTATSAVHFMKCLLPDNVVSVLLSHPTEKLGMTCVIDHPKYNHSTKFEDSVVLSIANDMTRIHKQQQQQQQQQQQE